MNRSLYQRSELVPVQALVSSRTAVLHGFWGDRVCWSRLAGLLILVAVLNVIGGCQPSTGEPARPHGVPSNAFWVGGVDGGVFVEVERKHEDPSEIYRGVIYHDRTGSILYNGTFRVEPQDQTSIDLANHALFEGWDGDVLYLHDGRKLKATR